MEKREISGEKYRRLRTYDYWHCTECDHTDGTARYYLTDMSGRFRSQKLLAAKSRNQTRKDVLYVHAEKRRMREMDRASPDYAIRGAALRSRAIRNRRMQINGNRDGYRLKCLEAIQSAYGEAGRKK